MQEVSRIDCHGQSFFGVDWQWEGILFGGGLWHTAGMNKRFFEDVKRAIKDTGSLSVEALGLRMGLSESQTYRVLRGDAPYFPRYTAIIREYVGLGGPESQEGTSSVAVDWVDLRTEESLEREMDLIGRVTLPRIWLPTGSDPAMLKLVRIKDDHCAPAYKQGDYALVSLAETQPEPSGVFLIWTGLGFKLQHVAYVLGTDPAEVCVTSTNPVSTAAPVQIPLRNLTIKGRLIGKVSIGSS